MSRVRHLRDAALRRILGFDARGLARDTARTRRLVDEAATAGPTRHAALENRLGRLARALDDVRDRVTGIDQHVAGLDSLAKSVESIGRDIDLIKDQLATMQSGSAATGARLESGVAVIRRLAESDRDDIPRLRRRLAGARSATDYDKAYDEPDPLVSVRIASYQNTEALIERAVASILRQTHQNFEIIVVNDGPNAKTRAALDALDDRRIRYVEFPFRRVYPEAASHRWMVAGSPGMNEGARLATGSWIAPLDDDDEFADDHIERLLSLARTDRAELVYGALDRYEVSSGEHERIFAFPPRRGGFTFQGAIYHAGLRFFEYDEESWRVEEPGDWNLCRRMLAAGVRIAATESVVGTMYRIPFEDKADDPAGTGGHGVTTVKAAVGRAGRRVVRRLPPPVALRVREVKRAALGQAPVTVRAVPTPAPTAVQPARLPAVQPTPSPQLTHPRPQEPDESRLETRRRNIFASADRSASALEIGPAHNAILPKREGFATRTVDYLDRAGLVEKYKEFAQYSPDDIEDVDYVLPPGAAMGDVITDRFDLVVASHVIEHTTSLIDFVNECARLLKPGGALALVVPDHRYCFDRIRERSSIGAVIDSALNPTPVHTAGTLTEFALYAVRHRGNTSWAPHHRGHYSLVHNLDEVRAKANAARSGTYVDVHHWIFSPNHLRLMLHDLADLGYITLREQHFHDTVGHEFFLNLTAESAGPELTREQLVDRADEELRTLDRMTWEPTPAG